MCGSRRKRPIRCMIRIAAACSERIQARKPCIYEAAFPGGFFLFIAHDSEFYFVHSGFIFW
ncbi:protein of unknown function [Paraburkholderia dioscoreae]|uniref:Uncharacterized protein n=1 Tax=Paraburkholderia dioscoreae TaxID=2604047 RepID=A0A5Q4Z1U6_9BURK|nr:protein of unknown function [Paraburkholderia dioscoreae]